MKSATDSNRYSRRMGVRPHYLIHGGLLACAVFIAAQCGVSVFGREPVSFNVVASALQTQNAPFVGPPVPVVEQAVTILSPVQSSIGVAALFDATVDYVAAFETEDTLLSEEMQRVRDWVSDKYGVSGDTLEPVLVQTESCARDAGLDPLLIVAVMAVESSFDSMAVSRMGAQGLMQVIPRWHMDKIGEDAGENALFDPLLNVQVGTQVLVEGLQRFGTLQAALQYYGGARNDPEARYSKRVLAMKQRLALVSSRNDSNGGGA